jgi:hypothetical protein
MSSVKTLNAKAEVMGRGAALFMNINAAKGLHDVMRSNLGPKGTIKMLVGGSGGAFAPFLMLHIGSSEGDLAKRIDPFSSLVAT